jgi:hypothetical protein
LESKETIFIAFIAELPAQAQRKEMELVDLAGMMLI